MKVTKEVYRRIVTVVLFYLKKKEKESIKKIYVCTHSWIKKFLPESATVVNWVSIFLNRAFVSIGTATGILQASLFFFFSRH